jgi:hypothetical protein
MEPHNKDGFMALPLSKCPERCSNQVQCRIQRQCGLLVAFAVDISSVPHVQLQRALGGASYVGFLWGVSEISFQARRLQAPHFNSIVDPTFQCGFEFLP